MDLMVGHWQSLIVMIQVNFYGGGNTNSHELSSLKNFAIDLPSHNFLAATFDFTSFFIMASWGAYFFAA